MTSKSRPSPRSLAKIHDHLFSRSYMSVIERNRLRIKATGEVFTPTPLVEEILDTLDPSHFENSERTFLDPACGDGQFLASILWRKLENGDRFEEALSTIYGVDIMQDNVDLCRTRLACNRKSEKVWDILKRNIIKADALDLFGGNEQFEMFCGQ